ncbi:hypothetical protein N9I98_01075 [Flavobacteriales bacterium]|nr:hypothetical protein [Flavobacteriales bacterium]
MRYKKLLEVKEDGNRLYFAFFKNNEQKIIALPKAGALNKAIYAGSDYSNLKITTGETAKIMLDSLMKSAIKNHPKFICCDSGIQKLLKG